MTALASPAASFIPRTLATAWRRCCGPLPAVLSSPRPPPPATNGAPTTTSTMAAAAREQRSARRPACSATWTWCRGDYERLADFIPNLVHRSAFLTSRSRCCWLPHLRILVRGLRCLRFVIVVIRSHLIVFLRILERRPVYFSCILAQRNKHNFITSLILKCLELLVSTMDFFSSSLTYHQH
jgi:hypothetical protein